MEKYIDAAVEQFRTLLNEQIARERKMEQDKRYTDYKKLDKIIIGVVGGDGIVLKGVENTIRAVSSIARDGMRETDNEIIRLMIGEETVK